MAVNDLEVLAPTPVVVKIGERVFSQKPLSLRGTTRLVVAISEELQNAASSPALSSLLSQDLANVDAVGMVPIFTQVLGGIPDALPRILTVILTGEEHIEDIEYIDAECRFPQAVHVLRTFIEQNEPEVLVEDFMVLRSTLSDALSKAKAKVATPA